MTTPPTHHRQITALALTIAAWLTLTPRGAFAGEPIQPAGSLAVARRGHTATVLADGRVLIVGGLDASGPLAAAEIFDPGQKTFSSAGNLVSARYGHTATLLANGRVLIAGGQGTSGPLASAEIFDPADATGFRLLPATMGAARAGHTATVRSDGTVLLAGGDSTGTAEIFDPATESFYTPLLPMGAARFGHTATPLADDNLFLVGGGTTSIELFNAASNSFSLWPQGLSQIRSGHSSIPTSDGRLLVVGGDQSGTFELFDPTAGSSPLNLSLGTPSSTANLLANNKILVLGPGVSGLFDETTDLLSPLVDTNASLLQLSGHTATELPTANKQILVAGGIDNSNNLLSSATLYNPAKISTDAGDYPPFSWVNIYGEGFLPNETVTNQVEETVGPAAGTNFAPWSVTADTNGSFATLWQVFSDELLDTTLRLSAIGRTSGLRAETTFTDANSSTAVASSPNPSVYGSAVTFTATVSKSGGSGSGAPTGTVTFKDGSTTLGTGTLTPGGGNTATATYTTTATQLAAGSHTTITAVYSGDGTYGASTSPNFTQTVNPKPLFVSGLGAHNKTYDGTTGATLTGTASLLTAEAVGTGSSTDGKPYTGDVVSLNSTAASAFTGTFTSKNAASGIAVNVTGNSLIGAQAGNYTLSGQTTEQSGITANITAKALNYTGISAVNKVYDATTTATLSGTATTLTAEAAGSGSSNDAKPYTGDTVSFTTGTLTGAFASQNVANGIAVTVTGGVTLTGAQSANYSVGSSTAALTANITAKPLNYAGINAANKVYDATATATLSGTAATLTAEAAGSGSSSDGKPYSGDTVSFTTGTLTGTFASKNVANGIAVTVTGGVTLTSGGQSANYSVGVANPALTANITAKALNYTGISAANKVYDATTTATLSGTATTLTAEAPGSGSTSDGAPYTGDTVSFTTGTLTGTFASKGVANGIAVTVTGGVTLTGAQSANYSVGSSTAALTANITAKPLNYAGINAANKVYDATATATLSGSATTLTAEAAGSGSTSDGKPYTGDTVSFTTGTLTGTFASKNVANGIAVTVTGGVTLTPGGQSANYSVGVANSALTANITAKALNYTGISAADKVYDATATAALSGTAATLTAEAAGNGSTSDGKPYTGDTVSFTTGTLTGTFASKNVANGIAVTVTGGVTLTPGGQSANYSVGLPNSALTANITAKALNFTGITAANKVYDATTTATLSGTASTLTAEAAGSGSSSDGKPYTGDTVSFATGTLTGTFASQNVANGVAVTVTGGATLTGTQSGNYSVGVANSALTANITAKALNYTGISAGNKVYDATTTATLSGTATTLAAEAAGSGSSSDGKPYTGDTASFTTGTLTGTFASKNVANGIAVTVTGGLTLGGTQTGNYSVGLPNPALTANITAKALNYSGISAANKVYDATTAATLSGIASALTAETPGSGSTSDGAPYTGDTVSFTTGTLTGAFASQNVANGIAVTVAGGLTLGGAQSGNYSVGVANSALTANITAKALNYTGVSAPNKVYDATTAATLSGTATALTVEAPGSGSSNDGKPYTGDMVSFTTGTLTGTFAIQNVANGIAVTVTGGLTLAGAQSGNYSVGVPNSVLTANITGKLLTMSGLSVPASKVYDATTTATVSGTPALSAPEAPGTGSTADGAPYSGDTVSITGTPTGTYNSKDVATATTVTFGGLSLTGAQAGDYTLTIQNPASASITARPVSLTGSRTYDSTQAATASILTIANNLDDGNLTLSGTATLASKNAGIENITSFAGLTLGGSAAGNYTLTGASGSVTINALVVSVTGSRNYDGTSSAAAAILSVANNLDDGNLTLSGSVTLADKDVPSQNILSFATLTLGGSAAGNYTLTGASGSVTISPLPVVFTGTRTYDSTSTAAFTILTIANKVTGDVVNISAGAATLAGKDVGTQSVLSFSGGTTVGNDKADYTVTGASGSVIITAATLTVTPIAVSRAYTGLVLDNTAYSDNTANYSISGFQDGETVASAGVTLSGSMAFNGSISTSVKNVGTYTQAVGTLALSSVNNNYALNFSNPTPNNYVITAATLSVTANSQTKVYGGTDPALTFGVVGLVGTDTAAAVLTGGLTRAPGEHVSGSPYAITQGTLAANPNYTISFTGNTLSITPATLTVTADHQTKVYGQPDPSLTYQVSGLQFTDTAAAVLAGSLTRAAGETVAGSPYAIGQGTLVVNSDYTIAFTGNYLSITAATLTVTVNHQTKVYGSADPTLSYMATGFKFTDTAGSVLTGALTRAAGEHVAGSPYPITQGTLTANANYTIAFTGNTLSITAATLTVKADPQTKVYGAADPSLSYVVMGLQFSDTEAMVLSGSLTRATGESVAGSPYAINQGTLAANSDYTIAFNGNNLSITAATLTVTANHQTKVYGTADPALTYGAGGFQFSDTAGSVLTGAMTRAAGEHVSGSPYPITQGTLAANANYTISFTGSSLDITPATLTVTADHKTKVYGAADPSLPYQVSGLQFTDTEAAVLTGSLTRAAGETVAGSPYAISQGTLAANSDYTIAFTGNNLSITAATLIVTANHQTKVYGSADPTLSYMASGFKFTDTTSTVLTGALTRTAGEHLSGSPYPITQGTLAANANYTISFTGNTLSITPATLTVTADHQTKVYGQPDPSLTYQVSGLQFTDTAAAVLTGSLTRAAGETVAGSPYAISQGTLAANSDYTIAFTGNNLSITAATLTVTANHQTKVYGSADPTLSYMASGFQFSDTGSSVLTGGLTRVAGEHVSGSPYAITQGTLAANPNYTISFTGNTLSITPATLTVTADHQTKVYGQPDPSLTYQVSGLQFTDTAAAVLTGSLTRAAGETVAGSPYAISQGTLAANSDYTIAFTGNNLSITAATLTVTANHQTKVYGSADPTLSYMASGFQFSDTGSSVLTGGLTRAAGEHVSGSPYPITQGTLAANANYTISFTGNTLSITPATLTVTADHQTKVYGQPDPTLTYVAMGFQFSDTAGSVLTGALTRASGETVAGSPYAIGQGTLGANSDYTIAFTGSTLDITPATLNITANDKSKIYGQTVIFAGTEFSATGVVTGDTVNNVTLTSAGAAVGATVIGSPYSITPSAAVGTGLANYDIRYLNGTLTVGQASTSTSLSSSENPTVVGHTIIFTATVTDSSPSSTGTPSGMVTFKEGATTLGTPMLNALGVATFSTSSLSVGSHTITVVYGGDGNFIGSTSGTLTEVVLASVNVTFLPPLAGQPVGNKIKVGQVVPHKVDLVSSLGQSVTSGVTVKLKVQGIDTANNSITVFQDVAEDANGLGTDGTVTSDGILSYTSGHFQFNLDTGNFSDPNTYSESSRYYTSTVYVIDNATMVVLGSTTINLETGK